MEPRPPPERKRKTKNPCGICGLGRPLCICASLPKLDLATRLCLVIHAKELKRTTNTGRLAIHALSNSVMYVRGDIGKTLDLSPALSLPYRSLLFFPSEESLELTPELVAADPRPIQLIVPDGNWRQASKVQSRHPELKELPRVMIKTPNTSPYHLRAETSEEGMATLQAIAQAFSIIEGPDVGQSLMALYQAKLQATRIGRGQVPRNQN